MTTPPTGQRPPRARAPLLPSRRSAVATPLQSDQSALGSHPWSRLRLHAIGWSRRRGGASARVGGSAAPTWFLQEPPAGPERSGTGRVQRGGSERGRAQRDRDRHRDRHRAGPVLAAMDPLRAQQLAAELEVEMMADMYNRCGPPAGAPGCAGTGGCPWLGGHWRLSPALGDPGVLRLEGSAGGPRRHPGDVGDTEMGMRMGDSGGS